MLPVSITVRERECVSVLFSQQRLARAVQRGQGCEQAEGHQGERLWTRCGQGEPSRKMAAPAASVPRSTSAAPAAAPAAAHLRPARSLPSRPRAAGGIGRGRTPPSFLRSAATTHHRRAPLHFLKPTSSLEIAPRDGADRVDVAAGGKASLAASIANLAKTGLGTGILALPGAFKGAGLIWGSVFTAATALMAVFSLGLLGEMATPAAGASARPTLQAIGGRAAGAVGRRAVDLVLLLNNTGAMTSYLVIASTTTTHLVQYLLQLVGAAWGASPVPRQWFVLAAIVLISPLCLVREVNMLRFTSALALVAITLLVAMILLFALPWNDAAGPFDPCAAFETTNTTTVDCRGTVRLTQSPAHVLTTFVVFTNAYTCQQGSIPVLAELNRPTRRRKFCVAVGAIGIMFPLFLMVSIAGYSTFGDNVDSDILLSYPDGTFVTIARVGIIVDVLTSFPLMVYFTRPSIVNILRACVGQTAASALDLAQTRRVRYSSRVRLSEVPEADDDGEEQNADIHRSCAGGKQNETAQAEERAEEQGVAVPGTFISGRLEIFATVVLVSCSVGISMAVSDLGVVAAMTGAVGATSLGYILPGFLYLKLARNEARRRNARVQAGTQMLAPLVGGSGDIDDAAARSRSIMLTGAAVLMLLGAVLIPAGVALTLIEYNL